MSKPCQAHRKFFGFCVWSVTDFFCFSVWSVTIAEDRCPKKGFSERIRIVFCYKTSACAFRAHFHAEAQARGVEAHEAARAQLLAVGGRLSDPNMNPSYLATLVFINSNMKIYMPQKNEIFQRYLRIICASSPRTVSCLRPTYRTLGLATPTDNGEDNPTPTPPPNAYGT